MTTERRALRSRRGFLGLAAGVALAPLFSGCVQGSATRTRGEGVTFWYSFASDAERRYYERHFITAYNANASKQEKVTLTVKDSTTLERLQQTAIASGMGPTLVFSSGPSYALQYADAGKLVALDGYAGRGNWAQKVQPWAYQAGKVDGKLYSLPNSYESLAVYYNRETFDKYGWSPPTDRAEFAELCREAQGRNLMPVAAGNADWRAGTEWYVTMYLNHAAGPDAVHSALVGETPWTDPVFVDAITKMNDDFQRGWFGGSAQRYFTNKTDAMYASVVDGSAAMTIVGTWGFTELPPYFAGKKKQQAWDWAPVPALSSHVPPETYVIGSGGTFSINTDTEHADEAAAFLEWLISNPVLQTTAIAEASLQPVPVRLEAADFPRDIDPRVRRFYLDLSRSRSLGYTTWTFWPPRSNTFIYQKMDKVLTGQMTPHEYCAGLQEVFASERALGRVPPPFAPAGEEQ